MLRYSSLTRGWAFCVMERGYSLDLYCSLSHESGQVIAIYVLFTCYLRLKNYLNSPIDNSLIMVYTVISGYEAYQNRVNRGYRAC